MEKRKPKSSFLAFFLAWAEFKRWEVPDIHIMAVNWLEHRGNLAVLRCFRGFGKSTILATHNAWRFWDDPTYRILHQGDQDKTAYKTSRDTKAVLARHPWTAGWFAVGKRGEDSFWWCPGAEDERNPSMQAAGITSNITSSRCDEAQNDDVEVPRNITNPEMREKMRYRLGEQVHIMVPGARQLYVGTPHTHDSIYDEVQAMGADCLTIKMFDQEHRIEAALETEYWVPFVPEFVFLGIGKTCRLLKEGDNYARQGLQIKFHKPPGGLVDFYAGSAWPRRFTPDEMISRRQRTRTINEWDSQYQLHSKPITKTRLDPDRMHAYDVEPIIRKMNDTPTLWLGRTQIVSMSCRWDPAGGKINSDVSAISMIMQDEMGRLYWHRAVALLDDIATFDSVGKVTGGQVWQICDLVEAMKIPRVVVENNGVGTTAPALLRAALKVRRLKCGVAEEHTTANKNRSILSAFEGPLTSGTMWAHVSVIDTVEEQMRSWNPAIAVQPDDYLDSGAKAINDEPVRVGRMIGNLSAPEAHDWRPSGGVHEVEVEEG